LRRFILTLATKIVRTERVGLPKEEAGVAEGDGRDEEASGAPRETQDAREGQGGGARNVARGAAGRREMSVREEEEPSKCYRSGSSETTTNTRPVLDAARMNERSLSLASSTLFRAKRHRRKAWRLSSDA